MNSIKIPDRTLIDTKLTDFNNLVKKLMEDLKSVYDSKSQNFETRKIKTTIDKCDEILRDIYGFTDDEFKYLIDYDSEIRKSYSNTTESG